MKDFLAMGGYAAFVWSAYAISAIVLVANVALALRRHRSVVAELARRRPSRSTPLEGS